MSNDWTEPTRTAGQATGSEQKANSSPPTQLAKTTSQAPQNAPQAPQGNTAPSKGEGEKSLVVEDTQQPVVEKVERANPYVFTPEQEKSWDGYDLDTEIARAWARMDAKAQHMGKPTAAPVESETATTQTFEFARAMLSKDEENKNRIVVFTDGRGVIGHESGL